MPYFARCTKILLDLTIYKLDCKSHKVTCISNKSNNLKLKCIILPLLEQFFATYIYKILIYIKFDIVGYPHFQYRKEEAQKNCYFHAFFLRRAFRCSVTLVLFGAKTHIWDNFPRTGKMVKMFFFSFFLALRWPNGLIFSTFLNCSEEILPLRF